MEGLTSLGLRIKGIETFLVAEGPYRNWLFVKVNTEEGISGIGEATLEGRSKTVEQAVKELSRYLVGRDPSHIEEHWQAMYRGGLLEGRPCPQQRHQWGRAGPLGYCR